MSYSQLAVTACDHQMADQPAKNNLLLPSCLKSLAQMVTALWFAHNGKNKGSKTQEMSVSGLRQAA